MLGGGFANKKQTFGITNTSAIEIEDLCCDHEEADTRMILHCRHVVLSSEIENVVVWSPDTDVAILLAHHFEDLRCTQLHQMLFLNLSLANVLIPLAEKTVVVQNRNFHVQKHVCV